MSYLLYISRHSCTSCGNAWEHSDLVQVTVNGAEKSIRSVREVLPGQPLGLTRLQEKTVPFCYICADVAVAANRREMAEADQRWAETLRRKADLGLGQKPVQKPTKPAAPSGVPSIEDL